MFVFLKCVRTVLFHTFHAGGVNDARTIVLLKGPNQSRLFRRQANELSDEFGEIGICAISRIKDQVGSIYLPRFSIRASIRQIAVLLAMLGTGRRRYLDIFYLLFFSSMRASVQAGMPHVRDFICYNDQPFEVAAIIAALHQRDDVKTTVIQHGLILNEAFYFPSNAQVFRAWGELSRQHFRSRHPNGRLVVTGRYKEDRLRKSENFVAPREDRLSILAATSFRGEDLKQMVGAISEIITSPEHQRTVIAVKLHPATKAAWRVRLWLRRSIPGVLIQLEDIEDLAFSHDILLTKNSTSAVDFLLLGKPVIFLDLKNDEGFPSGSYGFTTEDWVAMFSGDLAVSTSKSSDRIHFLKASINV